MGGGARCALSERACGSTSAMCGAHATDVNEERGMAQQSQGTPESRRAGRRATPLIVVLGTAIGLALGVGGWWLLTRTTNAPASGVTQTIQAGDLHITTQLDAATIGP